MRSGPELNSLGAAEAQSPAPGFGVRSPGGARGGEVPGSPGRQWGAGEVPLYIPTGAGTVLVVEAAELAVLGGTEQAGEVFAGLFARFVVMRSGGASFFFFLSHCYSSREHNSNWNLTGSSVLLMQICFLFSSAFFSLWNELFPCPIFPSTLLSPGTVSSPLADGVLFWRRVGS